VLSLLPAKAKFTLSSGVFEGQFQRMLNSKKVSTPFEGVIFMNPMTLPGEAAPVRGGGFFSTGSASAPVEISAP
jgi:hypothetical protein